MAGIYRHEDVLLANDGLREDAFGLRVDDLNFALFIDANGKVAAEGSGDASLNALPGLTVTGAFDLRYNNTGGEVAETVTIGGNSLGINFAVNEGNLQLFSGTITFELLDTFAISGTLVVSNGASGGLNIDFSDPNVTVYRDGEEVFSAEIDIDFSLTEESGLVAETDAIPDPVSNVSLQGGNKSTEAEGEPVTLVELGPLSLADPTFNITNFSFSPSLEFEFTIEVGAGNVSLLNPEADFAAFSISDALGALDLVIGFNFENSIPIDVRVSGFSFTHGALIVKIGDTSLTADGGGFAVDLDEDVIEFYASNVAAFIGVGTGAGRKGVAFTEGNLGLAIFYGDINSGFAIEASGTVSILGIPSVSASGSLTLAWNTTGVGIDRTLEGSEGVSFSLNIANGFKRVGGS